MRGWDVDVVVPCTAGAQEVTSTTTVTATTMLAAREKRFMPKF
jgi:hypothetical protein